MSIKQDKVIFIGDSDTDIEAFKEVGLSIAFNSASEELKKVATHVIKTHNLADIIKYIYLNNDSNRKKRILNKSKKRSIF